MSGTGTISTRRRLAHAATGCATLAAWALTFTPSLGHLRSLTANSSALALFLVATPACAISGSVLLFSAVRGRNIAGVRAALVVAGLVLILSAGLLAWILFDDSSAC